MTDKPTPTDAELEALLLDKLPASKHYIRPVIEKMVAAMQAAIDKWGQPAQAAEPVATQWLAEMIMSDCGCSTGNQRLLDRIIDRIQHYDRANTAPQPVAREPLTPDQIAEIADAAHREYDRLVSSGQCAPRWSAVFAHLLEMHHGIKGDQHVE
jgi:hypothetical protein